MKSIYRNNLRISNRLLLIYFPLWIMLSAHILSCGWLMIFGVDTRIDDRSNYISSLYWVITTLSTVGYGDIIPVTNLQKLYAIMVQILGYGVFGFVIGKVASVLSKMNPARSRYIKNLDSLRSVVHYRSLPTGLQHRINDYYRFMYEKRLGYDETYFLEGLPDNLQTEVALHLKKEVLTKIPLFKNATSQFIREIALHLKPIVLTPGDYVFRSGDVGDAMYFIVKGELYVLPSDEKKVLTILKEGDFFGEIALFKNKTRTATVKAVTYCDTYYLSNKSFHEVISKYPDISLQIEEKIMQREGRFDGRN